MAWSDFTQTTVVPLAGDETAFAAPTGDASADIISAATNVNGIVITGVSLSVHKQGTTSPGSPYMRLLIGGVIQLECIIKTLTSDVAHVAMGGICAIEVAPGQAVSYAANLNGASGSFAAFVRVAWRHKA